MKNDKIKLFNKLYEENEELRNKITKLMNFISSVFYHRLDIQHKILLVKQLKYMVLYSQTLSNRLDLLRSEYNKELLKDINALIETLKNSKNDDEKEI